MTFLDVQDLVAKIYMTVSLPLNPDYNFQRLAIVVRSTFLPQSDHIIGNMTIHSNDFHYVVRALFTPIGGGRSSTML